jgi:glycosyltransferase involved in cell wall biosynthesis
MRVLTVGNSFPPQDLGGGYEAVWEGAVRYLESRGHTVRVLTVDHVRDPSLAEFTDAHRELRWYWRDHGFPDRSGRECLAIERHNVSVMKRQLADFEPDVVSWWSMGGITLSLLEVVRRRRLPAVAFVHDDWLDYGRRADLWHRRARRRRYPTVLLELVGIPRRIRFDLAAHYAFVSRTTRDHAIRRGLDLPDTSVLHSGIEGRFHFDGGSRPWRGRLLYVGRVDPRKGVAVAIEAMAGLPDATLDIVGDGPREHLTELADIARRLAIEERVRFVGPLLPDDLPTAYSEADAVIFPVLWSEPWGLVPLEAMASGTPVIATGRGGSGEYLVDEGNALLYPRDEPARLADQVRRLATDEELRRRLIEAGIATAERHTADAFNRGVEEALASASTQHEKRP